MNLDLKGKVALVTGASAGIGKACASALTEEGCTIVICSRNRERIERAAASIASIGKSGEQVFPIAADVSKNEDIKKLHGFVISKFGACHILINNTGGPKSGVFMDINDEDWMPAFENTVMSVVRLTKLFLPVMKKQMYGRIINITSTSVKEPIQRLLLSNALRPAVIGFSKSVSDEVAGFGITINNIAPGFIRTERHEQRIMDLATSSGKPEAEIVRSMIDKVPMGRIGKAEDIASLAVFLASGQSSYITGTTICVDGGRVRGIY